MEAFPHYRYLSQPMEQGDDTIYNSRYVIADFNTEKNMNIGINFMNQSAGDAGYNYLNAYATAAYSGVRFGQRQ